MGVVNVHPYIMTNKLNPDRHCYLSADLLVTKYNHTNTKVFIALFLFHQKMTTAREVLLFNVPLVQLGERS